MKNIFISEKTKKNQQELSRIGKAFVICDNWHDFAKNYNDKKDFFMVLPHQTKNGMWGVVYWEKGLVTIFYYSASTDTGEERKEVNQLSKLYTSLDIESNNPDIYRQSSRTNTDESIKFSEVYANYMIEKLVELQYNWNVAAVPGVGWDNVNFPKSKIVDYQNGEEYKNLKNDNDLAELKNKVSQWESATWSKDPEAVKDWWNKTWNEWIKDFKDYIPSDNIGINAINLARIKNKLDQLEKDNQQLTPKETEELKTQIKELLEFAEMSHIDQERLKEELKSQIDGSSGPTPVLDMVKGEKAKWYSLGYTVPKDLQKETKYLVDAGFKKDGEEYKLYQELKKFAADFSKDRVGGKPIDLYPGKSGVGKFTGSWERVFASAGWNDDSDPSKGWRVHVRLDDSRNKMQLLFALAHETAHTIIMLKEKEHKDSEKNYSPAELNGKISDGNFLYQTQSHSRAFWQVLFDGKNWGDGKGRVISNIEYLKSKLNTNDEKNEFDEYIRVSNEKVSNSSVRWVYFIYGIPQDFVGKIRRKKYFDENGIDAAWKRIRKEVLGFADNSMNYPPDQAEAKWEGWTKVQGNQDLVEVSEGRKRWMQIEIKQRNEDDDGKRRYKIYIYHNNRDKKFEWIDKNSGEKKEIPAETMNPIAFDLMRNLETSYPGGDDEDDWEIEGIISSPTTRSLDRSFYEICGYQAQQEQQAQVQIPPK